MSGRFDPEVLWQQINRITRGCLAITAGDSMVDRDGNTIHMLVGDREHARKIMVRYDEGPDTYTVTIGRTVNETPAWILDDSIEIPADAAMPEAPDWVVEDEADGITVDVLNDVMQDMFEKVAG